MDYYLDSRGKVQIMIWISVLLSIAGTFILYLVFVRNIPRLCGHEFNKRFSSELCPNYYLHHMLRDNHPLEFMYKGLERDSRYPRLLMPCLSVFISLGLNISIVIIVIISLINGWIYQNNNETIYTVVFCVSTAVFPSTPLIVMTIQNSICFRQMEKLGLGCFTIVERQVNEKWPGFYK